MDRKYQLVMDKGTLDAIGLHPDGPVKRSSHHVTTLKMNYCKRSRILIKDLGHKTRVKKEEVSPLMSFDSWIMFAPSLPSSSAGWRDLVYPPLHLFVTKITVQRVEWETWLLF